MAVVILNDFCDSSYSCLHTFTKVLRLLCNTFFSTSICQVDYLRGLITLESLVVLCLVRRSFKTLLKHNDQL